MINNTKDISQRKIARVAGLLYLLMAVTSAFGLLYVPSKIVVAGNATATANNIVASEMLFRIGIASNLIGQILFVFLVLTLYQLFKKVDENYAKLMVILVAISVPIAFVVMLFPLAPLILLSGADFLKVFNPNQLNALTMLFLDLYNYGILIMGIFWGLWLYPFGFLVYKSGFIPKILGAFLIIGCFSYLVDSFSFLLIPSYHDVISNVITLPMAIGELSMIFWLLIKGVKDQ